MFMHAHVSVNLFCTQDRYKLMKTSIFLTYNHTISWAGHNVAWDKSQQLKFGRNTYLDQLENLVTDGKVTDSDLKKC